MYFPKINRLNTRKVIENHLGNLKIMGNGPEGSQMSTNSEELVVVKRKRGRPPKNKDGVQSNNGNPNTNGNNIYQRLPQDDTGDDNPLLKRTRPNPQKSPPPIIVYNLKPSEVSKFIQNSGIAQEKIKIQLTPNGTKLFAQSIEEFLLLKTKLSEAKVNYYTYTLPEEKNTKIVLYGLPNMEAEAVKTLLNAERLNPTEVKKLKIRNARYDEQANYLLYFKRTDHVKVNDVRMITGLMNYRVKWEYFSPRNRGPTQCFNCQAYGHSSSNCNLQPVTTKPVTVLIITSSQKKSRRIK